MYRIFSLIHVNTHAHFTVFVQYQYLFFCVIGALVAANGSSSFVTLPSHNQDTRVTS